MYYPLIRKEFRLHRMAIIVAVCVAAAGEVLLPLVSHLADAQRDPSMVASKQWRNAVMAGYSGSGLALAATVLFAAVFGGASVAVERRERWIDFAAMLPVPRLRRAAVASLVGAALTLTMYLVHASVFRVLHESGNFYNAFPSSTLLTIGSLSLAAFGLARLAAIWMRSPSLIVTIVCGTLVSGWMLAEYLEQQNRVRSVRTEIGTVREIVPVNYTSPYRLGVVALGTLALVASFPIAARRVEP